MKNLNVLLEEYKKQDWVNVSKGNWSFLSCTDFISCYTKDLIIEGKNPFDHPVQVCIGEKSELWFLKSELNEFGARIKHINSDEKINELLDKTKRTGEEALSYIRNSNAEEYDSDKYLLLWSKIRKYYQYHLVVKYLGEYLEPEIFEKYSDQLKQGRVLFGEPIFNESEKLAKSIIETVSKDSGLDFNLLLYLTKDELQEFYKNKTLPSASELEIRYNKSLILGIPEGYTYITGENANLIESYLYHSAENTFDNLKGDTAFKGVAEGVARVILDTKSKYIFNDGDILVTGMTHVDYLPIVQKSSAIVTDAGGILSHAAIIARELKKPCVINTKNATKIIKDGDLLKVDANSGMVTIL
jgi:phosphohistidine swiveling domain-containing protein